LQGIVEGGFDLVGVAFEVGCLKLGFAWSCADRVLILR
jgi:hypothetical protein